MLNKKCGTQQPLNYVVNDGNNNHILSIARGGGSKPNISQFTKLAYNA